MFVKISQNPLETPALESFLTKLLATLKKETTVQFFLVGFKKIRTLPYDCFWIEYKYSNTKMIQVNIKHNYIFPDFIQFIKQMLFFIAVQDDIQKQLFPDVLQIMCS